MVNLGRKIRSFSLTVPANGFLIQNCYFEEEGSRYYPAIISGYVSGLDRFIRLEFFEDPSTYVISSNPVLGGVSYNSILLYSRVQNTFHIATRNKYFSVINPFNVSQNVYLTIIFYGEKII